MGALYMVLTLAVMVPMAFLTEAVISHLSSELQVSDGTVQKDDVRRLAGQFAGSINDFIGQSDASSKSFSCSILDDFEVSEMLDGDQSSDGISEFLFDESAVYRFFRLVPKENSGKASGPFKTIVMRLEAASHSAASDLSAVGRLMTFDADSLTCGFPEGKIPHGRIVNFRLCFFSETPEIFERTNPYWRWSWSGLNPKAPVSNDYKLCDEGLLLTRKL